MGGGEHHGAGHFLPFGDAFLGHILRLAAEGADDDDVAIREYDALDGESILGGELDAIKAVGDVLGWVQQSLGDDRGGLAATPASQVRAKVHTGAVGLVAHVAALQGGGAFGGIAFEGEHRCHVEAGRVGGSFGCGDGDERSGVGIKDAFFFQEFGHTKGRPLIGAAFDQPPECVVFERGGIGFGHGHDGLSGGGFWDESKGVDGETAVGLRQCGGGGAFLQSGHGSGRGQSPSETGKGRGPGGGVSVAEAGVERLPDFGFTSGAADAPGFQGVTVFAIVGGG